MIDKHAFAAGMGLLAGNFNKTLDAAVSRAYYGVLSSKLTTPEFERAIALSLEHDTFWPSAASLIQKVKPPVEAQGHAALEHVNRLLSEHGGHRYLPHEKFHELDAPTRAAVAAVGGLAEITNCPVERYATLARKFAAAYAESLQPKLPKPQTDGRVKRLVASVSDNLSRRDLAAGER